MSSVPSILTAVILAVTGQLLVKNGLNLLGNVDFASGLISAYLKIFISPYVIVGTLLYAFSSLFWIYALARVDLSFAYPFVALSYVLIILSSCFILGEHIPFLRWIGVLVICLGIFLISKS